MDFRSNEEAVGYNYLDPNFCPATWMLQYFHPVNISINMILLSNHTENTNAVLIYATSIVVGIRITSYTPSK